MTKSALTLIGLAVVAYVFFFVPLGQRTMYQHARRIAGTEEARELGREATEAAERLREHVEEQIEVHVREDGGVLDAGASTMGAATADGR
ncbi:MAG: hypothetical protein KF901_09245 [Myxococcales bacterium]|nr:hypothetical protein [Myxococcales bacterium]